MQCYSSVYRGGNLIDFSSTTGPLRPLSLSSTRLDSVTGAGGVGGRGRERSELGRFSRTSVMDGCIELLAL